VITEEDESSGISDEEVFEQPDQSDDSEEKKLFTNMKHTFSSKSVIIEKWLMSGTLLSPIQAACQASLILKASAD
jgi:hypothetical protein